MNLDTLLSHATSVTFETGKSQVERNDLESGTLITPADKDKNSDFAASFSIGIFEQSIEAQLDIDLGGPYATFSVIIRGIWKFNGEHDLTSDDADSAVRAFAIDYALPRLLAVIQAHIVMLSRTVATPAPEFPASMESDLANYLRNSENLHKRDTEDN
ncbi:hypothetical protein [Corynebacterium ulceribovis]|uniref:hypothetical protein n=1 Tax=Corynebacterium ulceribovis TaxID=487732 RepID=UPI000377DC5D|nr:hypothetical protein [Corynebacterium ulceribovis]